ncbi:hypothetical protein [Gottfriedia acidiceleris]|uniref:hypothetical protein n=1 Tax=Gottfriedia acidiceleris TaxID=371036 RepID=UPI003000430A
MLIDVFSIREICKLADIELNDHSIIIDDRGYPHVPRKLPEGYMAIYVFHFENEFIKIGKVGPKSSSRFQSHHYNPKSSKSNLAKSILLDDRMLIYNLNDLNVGSWIKENIHRVDIFIDESIGVFTLNLIEAFLHCKYNPRYEG